MLYKFIFLDLRSSWYLDKEMPIIDYIKMDVCKGNTVLYNLHIHLYLNFIKTYTLSDYIYLYGIKTLSRNVMFFFRSQWQL